jgi:hypothetical protein
MLQARLQEAQELQAEAREVGDAELSEEATQAVQRIEVSSLGSRCDQPPGLLFIHTGHRAEAARLLIREQLVVARLKVHEYSAARFHCGSMAAPS